MPVVSARPRPCGPIRMPARIRMTTWGMPGPGIVATIIGVSAATSVTTSSDSSPCIVAISLAQPPGVRPRCPSRDIHGAGRMEATSEAGCRQAGQ